MFGINFLNPLFWIASLSVLIPVFFHFTFFQKAKNVKFSTLKFLRQNLEKAERKIRLEQLILLLLRMLIIILVVLAITKPVAKFLTSQPKDAVSRKVAVILDDSYSMSYKEGTTTYFEKAEKLTQKITATMTKKDSFVLISGSQGNDILAENSRWTYRKTDITGGIKKAVSLLDESSGAKKEIYILTDMQGLGWHKDMPGPRDISINIIDVSGKNKENRAILTGACNPSVFFKNLQVNLEGVLYSSGNDNAQVPIKVFNDESQIAGKDVSVKANEASEYSIGAHISKDGINRCTFDIPGDNLEADNKYYVISKNIGDVKLLCVDDSSPANMPTQNNIFLKCMLESVSTSKNDVLSTVHTEDLLNLNLSDFAFIIVNNLNSRNSAAIEKLKNYVRQGGSVLFFLSSNTDMKLYNEMLAGPDGELLGCFLEGSEGQEASKLIYYGIAKIDYTNQVLNNFKRDGGALNQIRVYRLLTAKIRKGAKTLIELEGERPLLIENGYGLGNVFTVTTSLDRNSSNLAINPAFIPLVYQMISSSSKIRPELGQGYIVGNDIPVSDLLKGPSRRVGITLPGGKVAAIDLSQNAESVIPGSLLNEPGFYVLDTGDKKIDFAVNPDTSESILAEISQDEVKTLLPRGSNVKFLKMEELEAQLQTELSINSGVWSKILLVVLLLLLLEGYYANRINPRH